MSLLRIYLEVNAEKGVKYMIWKFSQILVINLTTYYFQQIPSIKDNLVMVDILKSMLIDKRSMALKPINDRLMSNC
jgi:hypothetical protein